MRDVVKSLGMSLLTGVIFGLAAVATMLIVGPMFDDPYSDRKTIDLPVGINILEHKIKPASRDFTIQGRIENKSDSEWRYVQLSVEVYAGDAAVNDCDASIEHVKIDSIRNFEVTCHDISGINLPSNVTYIIRVESATRFTGAI